MPLSGRGRGRRGRGKSSSYIPRGKFVAALNALEQLYNENGQQLNEESSSSASEAAATNADQQQQQQQEEGEADFSEAYGGTYEEAVEDDFYQGNE